MTYATQDDIEARYPGELAQAGPRDSDNALDDAAIDLALAAADAAIDRALAVIGWPMPFAEEVVIPNWVIALAVDLALYLATPTVLASQEDFKDRRTRYQAATETLNAIAAGRVIPARPTGMPEAAAVTSVYSTSNERLFGRGRL
jgi:phage gp36-like protein